MLFLVVVLAKHSRRVRFAPGVALCVHALDCVVGRCAPSRSESLASVQGLAGWLVG